MLCKVIKRYPIRQLCTLFLSNSFFHQGRLRGCTVVFLLLDWFPQDASQRARFPSGARCWGGAVQWLGITATNRKRFMLSIHSYLRRERTWGPGQELLCPRKRKLTWLLVIPVHCIPCGKQAAVKYVGYSAGIDWLLSDRMVNYVVSLTIKS